MAIPLYVTTRGVVHVEDCVRLNLPHRPAKVRPWHGEGFVQACHTCMRIGQPKRSVRLPCVRCGHLLAQPCPHNGVLRSIERRRRGNQMIWCWPDKAIEDAWLRSFLD
jgi:hypothetical protein